MCTKSVRHWSNIMHYYTVYVACIHSSIAGITVGLQDTAYTVLENSKAVEICAILLDGTLEREANVMLSTISTIDDSATGIITIVALLSIAVLLAFY